MKFKFLFVVITFIISAFLLFFRKTENELYWTFTTQPSNIVMVWKNDDGKKLLLVKNAFTFLKAKKKQVAFVMNGGMFATDFSPVGLYVEEGEMKNKINLSQGRGNFYLKPNGVFFTTYSGKAGIAVSETFKMNPDIRFATQSGPMLVNNGTIHASFSPTSTNRNIRNGVGITTTGKVLMAISKEPVTLYEFATFFKNQSCDNALYLDGFVSEIYYPKQNKTDAKGKFGVMIAATE